MRAKLIELKMPWLTPDEEPTVQMQEWLVAAGAQLEIDQDVAKLLVNGEEFMLPSPVDGKLIETMVDSGDFLDTGQILAVIEL